MFEYFPNNYPWSLGVMGALNRGGNIGELDEACRPLKEFSARKDDPAAQIAWFESFMKLATRVERLADQDAAANHPFSAGRKYMRAGVYYFMAERMPSHKDPRRLIAFKKAISLYALHVPSTGGETRYMDMSAAYEALPAEVKSKISGLQARHVYDYGANTGNRAPTRESIGPNTKVAVHPIVRTHRETGKPILFVSRLFTVEVLGLAHEEGDRLLETLFTHIELRPDDDSHHWQVGDFLVWDNRILQHARNNFPSSEKRAMRRVPIADESAADS